jgi:ribonuclease HII
MDRRIPGMDSTSSPQRVILVGIDEAGFGPILGPLVVSSSSFSVPQQLLKSDLWQVLKKSAANKRKYLAGRLLIADSKKAHNKSLGIKHLQRTVLSCLKCRGQEPSTLTELLKLLCPDYLEQLSEYPWYQKVDSHKLSADKADIALGAQVLSDDLSSNGIELLELKSRCLDVAYYNKMVNAVKNKANVLFTATSQLIKNAFDNFKADDLQIIIDRQGGRVRYRKALQLMFPDMELRIISESQNRSSYELQTNGKLMRLHFIVRADDLYLPVSLASMVSKYLRELLVYNINCYFASFGADLKPTAGYWKDGLRFIKDIKTNLPHVKYDENQLIRLR